MKIPRSHVWLALLCGVLTVAAGPPPPRAPAGLSILISLEQRYLWLVRDGRVVLQAPVAIGVGENFVYNGKTYRFETPRGRRSILKKEPNPIWHVPEWHYYEKAVLQKLTPVYVKPGEIYPLEDSTYITMRGNQVGRVNRFGNFWPFTPGIEIIQYGRLYIPPFGSAQRRVPEALGPYKLDMGNGYLIHGTNPYTEGSVGLPVSHGCVRMTNHDLEELYRLVPVGTPVFID